MGSIGEQVKIANCGDVASFVLWQEAWTRIKNESGDTHKCWRAAAVGVPCFPVIKLASERFSTGSGSAGSPGAGCAQDCRVGRARVSTSQESGAEESSPHRDSGLL